MKKETMTRDVFIAEDGKEFYSEKECLEHEQALAKQAQYEQALERIDKLTVTPADDIPYIPLDLFMMENGNMNRVKAAMRMYIRDGRYQYARLEDREDAQNLAAVIENAAYNAAKSPAKTILRDSEKVTFPCTVLYGERYHWGREFGNIQKEMKLIRKYFKIHGYEVTFKEEQADVNG